jgi:RNA polymerase sigma-70 factor (ECF subfamily)
MDDVLSLLPAEGDERVATTFPATNDLSELFRAHERAVWGLAYRMTGCAADADDVVQETFTRALEGRHAVEGPAWKPWLMRVAVNLGIDMLRRRRRQAYVGAWLPSPIETEAEPSTGETESPEARYSRLESVSFAFLLALEALSPRQRAVLLLRDVFDYSGREVGDMLSMSEANVRITHHRARRVMQAYDGARRVPTRALQERTATALAEFLRCLTTQDVGGIQALLADGVRTLTDGGGEFNALHGPLVGAARVATLHLRVARRRSPGARTRLRLINGLPALVIEYALTERRQAPRAVLRCEVDAAGRITEVHVIMATRKLTAVRFDAE